VFAAQERGGVASREMRAELGAARREFEALRPFGAQDAEAAYRQNPTLAREAGQGAPARAVRALQLESELRTDPAKRADRFVERWHGLEGKSLAHYRAGEMSAYRSTRAEMGHLAKSLERDPQLESLLAGRKRDLGIAFDTGRSLGHDLALGLGLGRGRPFERR
jgi:hypothetical protein